MTLWCDCDAINIFYRQIILRKGLPFPLELPNEETLRAIKDVESGKGVKEYKSVQELMDSLNSLA